MFYATVTRAQTVTLSGTARERGTTEAIPGASLLILGTSRGARSNADGNYRLALDRGTPYSIRVTAIGYRPDTLNVTLFGDSTDNIALVPAPIMGRVVTVSANSTRDEARRIMHKVIDSKDAWQSQIEDYQFHVYSRLNFKEQKDTSSTVLGVLESVANGFWKRDKGYAEKITARKQTANMPAEVNQVALFDIDNFYNDRLDFGDYSVVSPVAHDAFDRYDYDLIGEGELNGSSVFKISVEPRSDLYPAFQGTLWIDKADYTIAYLDLSPNDAIKIGPIKNIKVQQTFSIVDNKYWMPSEIGFSCTLKLEMPFIPAFSFAQTATLQDYIINGGLPDSLFRQEHTVAESADSVDSLHWVALRTIPLAKDEAGAYHTFDSIAKIPPKPQSFSPTGLLFSLIPGLDVYQYN
ncbi:MAG TPA: DUF5686 family protein, partial [Candidatus Kapabacteria bacterium]|nr:DUF5686 family protein [Candidatus Kapabacteria bacterium]